MLANFPLSEKQVISFQEADARLNIWEGAVRSGKTFVSILKLIERIRNGPPGDVMLVGLTRTALQRNILVDMYRLLGFAPPSPLTVQAQLYGRNIYFVGANNEGAARTIKGSTLALAYVDEVTQIPRSFWSMLLSRLSENGAQLFATCNPEGPAHWLKKDFLDRKEEVGLKSWQFKLDDNPELSESYKKSLKIEYGPGLLYRRFILGEWSLANGVIYDGLDHVNLYEGQEENPSYRICGIDYGTVNPTAAVLIGVYPNKWPQMRIIDEYYYDSKKSGRSKTNGELADDIVSFIAQRAIRSIYVDPSAESFQLELRDRDLTVMDANNDVLNGLRVTSNFISQKNIVFNKSRCPNLLESLYSYVWNEKESNKGEEKPVKENDHAPDALRYAIYSAFPRGKIGHKDDDLTIDQIRNRIYGNRNYLDF